MFCWNSSDCIETESLDDKLALDGCAYESLRKDSATSCEKRFEMHDEFEQRICGSASAASIALSGESDRTNNAESVSKVRMNIETCRKFKHEIGFSQLIETLRRRTKNHYGLETFSPQPKMPRTLYEH